MLVIFSYRQSKKKKKVQRSLWKYRLHTFRVRLQRKGLVFHFETIIFVFKGNSRTNVVSALSPATPIISGRLLFSLIFTRRRLISSQGHGLIDFYFHSIFPRSLLSCQPPWNKTSKRRRKSASLLTPQEAQKSPEKAPKRSSSLRQPKGQNNKCRFN